MVTWPRQLVPLLLLAGCNGQIDGPLPGGANGVGLDGSTSTGGANASGAAATAGTSTELDCSKPQVPPAPLRRLTREQYVNGVASSLGVDVDAAALAADQRAGAFASNFSAAIDDLGTEQYASMAEAVAGKIGDFSKFDACAQTADTACATKLIEKLGRRLYRRPLTPAEAARYQALYAGYSAPAAGGFANGMRVLVQGMLQSPSFLYLVEPAAPAAAADRALSSFELATRLAGFVWNSTPDDRLLDVAASGMLQSDVEVRAQVESMLADPRASATIRAFHRQWLGLEAVGALAKDPSLFPGFGVEQRDAMLDETLTFVDYVFRSADGKLETLLSAPYSFPKPALFSIYRLPAGTASDGVTPVMLNPAERAGVLTQPAFLAVNAHAKVSAPIKRGNVVLKNILCLTTPSPPEGVKTELPDAAIPTTQREQVKQHEMNPACAACHHGMDGIGLGFEAYDAVGVFRSQDAGLPVDASGDVTGTSTIDGPFNGAVELAKKLGKSAEARACVTQQWYRYAVGRPEASADGCAIQSLRASFTASGGDLRALVVAIATSPGFRTWGVPASAEAAP